MITGMHTSEIKRTRSVFLSLVEDPGVISLKEFLRIPCIKINPLKYRLAACFGFDEKDEIPYVPPIKSS